MSNGNCKNEQIQEVKKKLNDSGRKFLETEKYTDLLKLGDKNIGFFHASIKRDLLSTNFQSLKTLQAKQYMKRRR